MKLTDRQQEVLDFLRDFTTAKGYPPTLREIGEHFGIKSPNGVACHLTALQKKGYIERGVSAARAITVLDKIPSTTGPTAPV